MCQNIQPARRLSNMSILNIFKMDIITSKKLAELVGKAPATIRKYAPELPGSEKHGNTWIFTDLKKALYWFKNRGDSKNTKAKK